MKVYKKNLKKGAFFLINKNSIRIIKIKIFHLLRPAIFVYTGWDVSGIPVSLLHTVLEYSTRIALPPFVMNYNFAFCALYCFVL